MIRGSCPCVIIPLGGLGLGDSAAVLSALLYGRSYGDFDVQLVDTCNLPRVLASCGDIDQPCAKVIGVQSAIP
jgi:hypothetical protein